MQVYRGSSTIRHGILGSVWRGEPVFKWFVLLFILFSLLPECRKIKRLRPGCETSDWIFLVPVRRQEMVASCREGRGGADDFFITPCRAFLSAAVQPGSPTVMPYAWTLSTVVLLLMEAALWPASGFSVTLESSAVLNHCWCVSGHPRYLMQETLHTVPVNKKWSESPLMWRAVGTPWCSPEFLVNFQKRSVKIQQT